MIPFLVCFLSGVTNHFFRLNIFKSWALIEVFAVFLSVVFLFYKRLPINKVFLCGLIIAVWSFFSVYLNSHSFSSSYYVTDVSTLFTEYGTRGYLVSLQLLFNLFVFVSVLAVFRYLKYSAEGMMRFYTYAACLFSLIGLVVYVGQLLGMKFGFVQSNEVSYSKYRFYSLAVEPQFAALFLLPGVAFAVQLRRFLLATLLVVSLLLTFSTSILAGVAVVLLIKWMLSSSMKDKVRSLPLVVTLIGALVPFVYVKASAFVSSAISVGDGTNDFQRVYAMYVAVNLIAENWFYGIGWGNFPFYIEWRGEEKIVNLASLPLRFLCELGFIGGVLFIFFASKVWGVVKLAPSSFRFVYGVVAVYFLVNSTYFAMPSFWVFLAFTVYVSEVNYDFKVRRCHTAF